MALTNFANAARRWSAIAALALAACAAPHNERAGPVAADRRFEAPAASAPATPAQLYGELFERVQLEQAYPDSKTFVDALPGSAPAQIMAEYHAALARPGFELRAFLAARFTPPLDDATAYRTIPGQDVREHIDRLWSVLERPPDDPQPYSSRLPLPQRYVVPGGRFREIYYWDSYFTMLGLEQSGRRDLMLAMVRNFAHLIETYGRIPNGARTYYLSRSQPPFFAAMVELAAGEDPRLYRDYLPQLKREYAFWMDGADELAPNSARRRVVRLNDGSLLNRYWDDRASPREEAYREDVATAAAVQRPAAEVYRNLRAAAESGWDFSSRWLADGRTLATIRTADLAPPDLNSLLYQLELTIAKACALAGDAACDRDMRARAQARRAAIQRVLWDEAVKAYTDYDWRARRSTGRVSAAALYPLFCKATDVQRAHAVAATVRKLLLQRHGLAATTVVTGEQWDAPNGWAPLQWIAIQGLKNYGEERLANEIARRWVAHNLDVFHRTGKLVEKYDVTGSAPGGGGEYPLQDGFGWTNGVLRKLLGDVQAKPAALAIPPPLSVRPAPTG